MDNVVKRDFESSVRLLNGTSYSNDRHVYFETNEYIKEILDNFDIENKSVLTVLGSGDQAFHFYIKGAQRVDVFDINRLALYYYYLRRWTIQYLNKSYPIYDFDGNFLNDLLSRVSVKNVQEADLYKYWEMMAGYLIKTERYSKDLFNVRMLGLSDHEFDNRRLSSILEYDEFDFYNINIAGNIKTFGKYDIIYTSNISDYVNRSGSFNKYRLNLKKLLKKDGIVISSRISGFSFPEGEEILEKSFKYNDLDDIYQPHMLKCGSPGYYYTKKKLFHRFLGRS